MISDLRKRAEERLKELAAGQGPRPVALSGDAALLHDLHVHQIELEMQNEELRRVQAELEASRARYFDLYDLAPVGYLTVSETGLIAEANLTAARLFGVARAALILQPMTRFIVAEDQDAYYLHQKRLFATGAPQALDLRMKRGDGTRLWARMEAATAQDPSGVGEACRVIVSDVSARKLVEEERLQLERELQQAQKGESLARMAGAIAHHFNNQLAVIMSNLELVSGETAGDRKRLANATLATRKAAEVSGLLLTYLGQTSGNHEPLDLADACARFMPLLRAAAPAHVVIEPHLPVPGPTVNGNASQLQLMVTNLVTNAWEAVGHLDSTIQLTVKTVPASQIPTSHRLPAGWKPRNQAYACVEVIDPGCGIDEHEIVSIFDPFFTSKFTGRGLGLPVVLGILHAHNGGLVVNSTRGRESGSTFQLYLPLSSEQVAPARRKTDAPVVAEPRWEGCVLLVDDDLMLRSAAKANLIHLGFTVLEAANGMEAVGMFRQHQDTIRLVLCDLTMPHMGGWETLAAVRAISPGVPVILSSGYDEDHVMSADSAEQPQAFLAKPYSLEELRAAIRPALAPAATEGSSEHQLDRHLALRALVEEIRLAVSRVEGVGAV